MNTARLLILAALFGACLSAPVTCPFHSDYPGTQCKCEADEGAPSTTFSQITCLVISGYFVPFNTTVNAYTVTGTLSLLSEFDFFIPPGSFLAFKSINKLYFKSTLDPGTISLNFDPNAFVGPKIDAFETNLISAILPIPEAVRQLGRRGLSTLSIGRSYAISVGEKEFKDFRGLNTLKIENCHIESLADTAFVGLEYSLVDLSLASSGLTSFPSKAIDRLFRLQSLDLSYNPISSVPKAAFAPFPTLKQLKLSKIDLSNSTTAFDLTPFGITSLYLDQTQLTSVPTRLLNSLPNLANLNLSANSITALRNSDFPRRNKITYLNLDKNPIATIDTSAFAPLKSVQQLSLAKTSLQSIDLSIFQSLSQLQTLVLSNQTLMETVNFTDKLPSALTTLDLSNSRIEKIDPKLAELVGRKNFQLLDISRDRFTCDASNDWMAKYVFCSPVRIDTTFAYCTNLFQLLDDYLRQVFSQTPCQSATA